MTINAAKLVAHMTVEKRVDALLAQVGGPVRAAPTAYGDVSELEAALAFVVSVVFVPSLQIADDQLAPGPMVCVVGERLHRLARPTLLVGDPSVIRGELDKVPNQRLHQVLRPPDRVNIPPCDQDGFVPLANFVPVLGVLDGPVRHFEIGGEKVGFQPPKLALEALADRLLLVAIPPDVRACVGRAEVPLADDFFSVESDAIGSGTRTKTGENRVSIIFGVGVWGFRVVQRPPSGEILAPPTFPIFRFPIASFRISAKKQEHADKTIHPQPNLFGQKVPLPEWTITSLT